MTGEAEQPDPIFVWKGALVVKVEHCPVCLEGNHGRFSDSPCWERIWELHPEVRTEEDRRIDRLKDAPERWGGEELSEQVEVGYRYPLWLRIMRRLAFGS